MTASRGTALVTGASAGLGWAYAIDLAERGHPLIVVARRADRLDALAQLVHDRFAVALTPVVADLGTKKGRALCRAAVDAAEPPLEVAVVNAGFGSRGPLADLDREREVAMVQLNCVAVTDLVAHVVPGMVARGRGDIVVVSSAAAFQPVPFMATYAATKAFELHLVESLAGELRGTGVRTVAVCPGPTRTEFSTGRTESRWPWMFPLDEVGPVVTATWRALDRGHTRVATGVVARSAALASRIVPRRLVRAIAAMTHRPSSG
jgi:uncharacterized protein